MLRSINANTTYAIDVPVIHSDLIVTKVEVQSAVTTNAASTTPTTTVPPVAKVPEGNGSSVRDNASKNATANNIIRNTHKIIVPSTTITPALDTSNISISPHSLPNSHSTALTTSTVTSPPSGVKATRRSSGFSSDFNERNGITDSISTDVTGINSVNGISVGNVTQGVVALNTDDNQASPARRSSTCNVIGGRTHSATPPTTGVVMRRNSSVVLVKHDEEPVELIINKVFELK